MLLTKTSLIASTLFFMSLLIHSCKNGNKQSGVNLEKGEIEVRFTGEKSNYQWNFKRNIMQQLELQKKIDFNDGKLLWLQYDNNNLIGLDYKESKLHFFNDSLETLFAFGKKGDAPAENKGIHFFEYSGANLQLYDFGKRALKKYNLDKQKDSLVYYWGLTKLLAVYRACHLLNNQYLYVQHNESGQDMDFVVLDSTTISSTYSFSKLIGLKQKVNYADMVYDGNFVFHQNSQFVVYYCQYTGLFLCFNKQTTAFEFFAKTVDQTPAPIAENVEIAPGVKSLEVKPNILFFPSASLYKDKLFLFNAITKDKKFVVDIYNLNEKGKYESSFFVPNLEDGQKPISITVGNDFLYVLYEDQAIARYRIL